MEPSRAPLLPAGRLRRLTVAEYMRMVDAGVFGEHERLELLDGVLCQMSPQSVPHARIIQVLGRLLFRQLSEQHDLRVQLPLQLGELSVPEPDLAVVERKESERRDSHPRHALLVIEVARESLREDRLTKGALYARHGIPEFWLVDVDRERVEVYRAPDSETEAYTERITVGRSEVLSCRCAPGLSVPLADIW
ncbi:MAG TPA: Uma2 family endonuclease [Archangium sp.]|nr:Uma2 family endonuclease [Archangium sp.]